MGGKWGGGGGMKRHSFSRNVSSMKTCHLLKNTLLGFSFFPGLKGSLWLGTCSHFVPTDLRMQMEGARCL